MDWKGQLARAYRYEPGASNLLLFDRSGQLVHRAAGRELDPAVLRGLVEALAGALESPPPASPGQP